MTLNKPELYEAGTAVGAIPPVEAKRIMPKTLASSAGAATLAILTPLAFNTATGFWQVWSGKSSEITTITANATPATAGTWTLTVDGITVSAIAYNVTAAALKSAIVNAGIAAPEDVSIATAGSGLGTGGGSLVITWGGALADQALTITADFSGLTGNVHVLTETQAGVAGGGVIAGFLWPDTVTLHATEEVLGQVLLEGKIRYSDIPLPAGESADALKAACRSGLREKGIIVEGLDQVH